MRLYKDAASMDTHTKTSCSACGVIAASTDSCDVADNCSMNSTSA